MTMTMEVASANFKLAWRRASTCPVKIEPNMKISRHDIHETRKFGRDTRDTHTDTHDNLSSELWRVHNNTQLASQSW